MFECEILCKCISWLIIKVILRNARCNKNDNCIKLYKYVTTCFDQLQGHPQATCTCKIRITTGSFIFGQNETMVLLLQNTC